MEIGRIEKGSLKVRMCLAQILLVSKFYKYNK